MTRPRLIISILASAMALVAVGLDVGLGPPARRINVRWADSASESDRARLEGELGLRLARPREGRTWSYELRDTSRANIQRLVGEPLAADTQNIDRVRFSVARDPSATPEWIRTINRSPGIRRLTRSYLPIATAFAVLGFVAAWPVVRRLPSRARASARWLMNAHAPSRRLAAILLASLLLRGVLVVSGGQFYWPDEGRYDHSRKIVQEAVAGDFKTPLVRLDSPDHMFFKILGIVPAAVEYAVRYDTRIPGLFFSLFSVANIWLVGGIARRLGATATESALASALLALSCTYFYYARHLVPYDVALTWGLLAIYVGVKPDAPAQSSLWCGVLAGCAFYTYDGYWAVTAAALVIHAAAGNDARDVMRRMMLSGSAAAGTVAAVLAVNALSGGHLLRELIDFARTITQGAFDEGWRVPFAYLWTAERVVAIVWGAGLLYWIVHFRTAWRVPRVRLALLGLAFMYGSLVVSSNVLHAFVVYGRLARQLVPFLVLLTAAALEAMRTSRSAAARTLVPAVLVVMLVQAAYNFSLPLRQTFPIEFLKEADDAGQNEIPGVKTVYVKHIYPVPEPFTMPAGYTVVKEAPHPLQFLPYQYEGYDPAQREALRSTDIRMRLIAPVSADNSP